MIIFKLWIQLYLSQSMASTFRQQLAEYPYPGKAKCQNKYLPSYFKDKLVKYLSLAGVLKQKKFTKTIKASPLRHWGY